MWDVSTHDCMKIDFCKVEFKYDMKKEDCLKIDDDENSTLTFIEISTHFLGDKNEC